MLCPSDWRGASTILGRVPAATCTSHVPLTDILLNFLMPCFSSQIHPAPRTLCPSDQRIAQPSYTVFQQPNPPNASHAASQQLKDALNFSMSHPSYQQTERVPVTDLQPHPSHLVSQQPSRPRTLRVVSPQPTYHSVCPSGHPHPKSLVSHSSDWPASLSLPCYAPLNIPTQTPACRVLTTLDPLPHPSHVTSWRRGVSSDRSAVCRLVCPMVRPSDRWYTHHPTNERLPVANPPPHPSCQLPLTPPVHTVGTRSSTCRITVTNIFPQPS